MRGERVLVIDADLQDPPELLPEMFEMMDRGADVVYGQRSSRRRAAFKSESATPSTACSTGSRRCRFRSTPATSG